jgi:hypothetical protein
MTNFKNIILGLSVATVLLSSCNNNSGSNDNSDKENSSDVFTKIYSVDNLNTQTFTIDNSIDNLITGESGTIIRINRNTFVDQEGKTITGKVEIELIEALTRYDMVLGNLTTTFDGKPLETGGMIYFNTKSKNKEVSIASDKSVQIKMPTDSTLVGMSVFEGQKDSLGVKWGNPVKLPLGDTTGGISMESFEKTTNVKYRVDGFENTEDAPQKVQSDVGRIAWEGDGLKITKDSVFKIDEYTVRFIKQKKLLTWSESFTNTKGENSFAEDRKTNYIFSLKKLGWANIDRLLEDPRTKEVELITSIENENDFEFIYVTMITQKMYLPGYQKKDETFCFSHNDEEKQQLPVGETATIMATAYKNDKPYFAIKKITITDKQNVAFKLEETTTEKLKAELKEKI